MSAVGWWRSPVPDTPTPFFWGGGGVRNVMGGGRGSQGICL